MESTNQGVIPLKIIIAGNNRTGKTCFMKRWKENIFTENYIQTKQFQSDNKIYVDQDKDKDKYYRITIIEIVCEKEWEKFIKDLVKDADGMILLVDPTNPDSRNG